MRIEDNFIIAESKGESLFIIGNWRTNYFQRLQNDVFYPCLIGSDSKNYILLFNNEPKKKDLELVLKDLKKKFIMSKYLDIN